MVETGQSFFAFLSGLLLGISVTAGAAWWLFRRRNRLARNTVERAEAEVAERTATLLADVRASFSQLSRDALSANMEDFFRLAATRLEQQTVEGDRTLEAKRKLIDQRLEEMGGKLTTVTHLMQTLEKQRAETHGTLTAHLERSTQATQQLHDTAAQLREALANPQRRGQWGERMAEDVLRLAGMIEGINYRKQNQSEGRRPDFTFLLPDDQVVHMDVKFPLVNYLKMLDAKDEFSRTAAANQFLKDVRQRLREVQDRGYIDSAGRSLDLLLVFIPNEQIYGFVHESDPGLIDESMRQRVVLCSPLTLYVVLAVIRQAADNFRVQMTSTRILQLLGKFKEEWDNYTRVMGAMGKKLDDAVEEYRRLTGVRTRQLDRQLDLIEDLRASRTDSDGAEAAKIAAA